MSDFQERVLKSIEWAMNHLGLQRLKDKQLEGVTAFIQGRDTFVILPTGYGKSIIYNLLLLVCDNLKLVPYYN